VTQAVFIAVAVAALALAWRNRHRAAGATRIEAFRTRMKIILLVLGVCGLCSKAIVHTIRHFNPPPPPIIGP
jgi:hypothetical protein